MKTLSIPKPPKPIMLKSVVDGGDLLVTDYFKNHCKLKHLIDNKISSLYLRYKNNTQKREEPLKVVRLAKSELSESILPVRSKRNRREVETNTSHNSIIIKEDSFTRTTVNLELPEVPQKRIHSAHFDVAPCFRVKRKPRPNILYKDFKVKEIPIKSLEFKYILRKK
jgi:hypothetical protein